MFKKINYQLVRGVRDERISRKDAGNPEEAEEEG